MNPVARGCPRHPRRPPDPIAHGLPPGALSMPSRHHPSFQNAPPMTSTPKPTTLRVPIRYPFWALGHEPTFLRTLPLSWRPSRPIAHARRMPGQPHEDEVIVRRLASNAMLQYAPRGHVRPSDRLDAALREPMLAMSFMTAYTTVGVIPFHSTAIADDVRHRALEAQHRGSGRAGLAEAQGHNGDFLLGSSALPPMLVPARGRTKGVMPNTYGMWSNMCCSYPPRLEAPGPCAERSRRVRFHVERRRSFSLCSDHHIPLSRAALTLPGRADTCLHPIIPLASGPRKSLFPSCVHLPRGTRCRRGGLALRTARGAQPASPCTHQRAYTAATHVDGGDAPTNAPGTWGGVV